MLSKVDFSQDALRVGGSDQVLPSFCFRNMRCDCGNSKFPNLTCKLCPVSDQWSTFVKGILWFLIIGTLKKPLVQYHIDAWQSNNPDVKQVCLFLIEEQQYFL